MPVYCHRIDASIEPTCIQDQLNDEALNALVVMAYTKRNRVSKSKPYTHRRSL